MPELDSPRAYLRAGVLYLILALPGIAALLAGRLFASRDIHLLASLLGVPLGTLFLLFGFRRPAPNRRSWYALRVAVLSLFFAFLLVASLGAVRLGAEAFATSAGFCLMAASYLGLVTLALGVWALFEPRETPPVPR